MKRSKKVFNRSKNPLNNILLTMMRKGDLIWNLKN